MIHSISSSLNTFKTLEFHAGLNILLARKTDKSTSKQTRNRAGKTSFVEIVHFLMGSDVKKGSLFLSEALANEDFTMSFDLSGQLVSVARSCTEHDKISVRGLKNGDVPETNRDWRNLLGRKMFDLSDAAMNSQPSFRSLFAYFARRQDDGGLNKPHETFSKQKTFEWQLCISFLLGIDWQIISDWKNFEARKKELGSLKKAAKGGMLQNVVGEVPELRKELAIREDALKKMRMQLAEFKVLPQYAQLETEADHLTAKISELLNLNVIDSAVIKEIEASIKDETPPQTSVLEAMYRDAGVLLPDLVVKRYEEVKIFHESVVRNRKDYLAGELAAARHRVAARQKELEEKSARQAEVMKLLKTHGALEQHSLLQSELSRKEADVEILKRRFEAAERLSISQKEMSIEKDKLALRLKREFTEQNNRLKKAMLAFEETSSKLYESAGSMTIADDKKGIKLDFDIQGSRSKSIKQMQIFCFDMMLMQLCTSRGFGPGVLIHDSGLFDGVDGRQINNALKIGAETAEKFGFQYIVTMNEDDAFKETDKGFDLTKYLLPVVLTDETDTGGLFGFRFE